MTLDDVDYIQSLIDNGETIFYREVLKVYDIKYSHKFHTLTMFTPPHVRCLKLEYNDIPDFFLSIDTTIKILENKAFKL